MQQLRIAAELISLVGLILTCAIGARLGHLWIVCLINHTGITLGDWVSLVLRRVDPVQVIRARILVVQAGLRISTPQLATAAVRGADVEKIVKALARAREYDWDVTFEECVETDLRQMSAMVPSPLAKDQ